MQEAASRAVETEYVREIPYPRRFIPQLGPSQLRLVAAMNGFATPPDDDFDYCELGCGNGDTLGILAAANPHARFVGVDFNADHVACARALAARGKLSNLRVLLASFADLAQEDLPQLDFIVAHGVLSWVGPETVADVLAFARAKLKPGGLLYVSYNVLPSWAAIEPLRRLMLDGTAGVRGGSLERAKKGLELAQRLCDAGAGYFVNHPTAKSMLALMRAAGLPYVVHEYFNAHLRPMYFADVAQDMDEHGLTFAGQLPLHLNVPELSIPPSIRKIGATVQDRVALETLKDFGTNELFRTEVYVRGRVERSVPRMRAFFERTRFGTTAPAAQIKREVRLPFVTVEYKGPVYDAILASLRGGPASAEELAERPELAGLGQERIGDCFRNLALGGQLVPMRDAPAPSSAGEQLALADPYNEVALDEALSGEGPLVLASPATGTGVHVSLLEALAIKLATGVEPAQHAAWLREYAGKQTMPIRVGDRKINDAAELTRVVQRDLERLSVMAPQLRALGVLAG